MMCAVLTDPHKFQPRFEFVSTHLVRSFALSSQKLRSSSAKVSAPADRQQGARILTFGDVNSHAATLRLKVDVGSLLKSFRREPLRWVRGTHGVSLVDLDPQGSLAAWWHRRGQSENPCIFTGETSARATETLTLDGWDWVFFDGPPAFLSTIGEAIGVAHLAVIPGRVRSRPHDALAKLLRGSI